MHESGKNSVCPITDFKICIDPASAEVSGTVSTGFNGFGLDPGGVCELRAGLTGQAAGNTFQTQLCLLGTKQLDLQTGKCFL